MPRAERKRWVLNGAFLAVATAGGLFLYEGALDLALRPQEHEQVRILVAAYGCQKDALVTQLEAQRPSGIERITVADLALTAPDFYSLYNIYAPAMDLILLPQSKSKQGIAADAATLDPLLGSGVFSAQDADYFWHEGERKGIRFYAAGSEEGKASSCIEYRPKEGESEDYFLFFPPTEKEGKLAASGLWEKAIDVATALYRLP